MANGPIQRGEPFAAALRAMNPQYAAQASMPAARAGAAMSSPPLRQGRPGIPGYGYGGMSGIGAGFAVAGQEVARALQQARDRRYEDKIRGEAWARQDQIEKERQRIRAQEFKDTQAHQQAMNTSQIQAQRDIANERLEFQRNQATKDRWVDVWAKTLNQRQAKAMGELEQAMSVGQTYTKNLPMFYEALSNEEDELWARLGAGEYNHLTPKEFRDQILQPVAQQRIEIQTGVASLRKMQELGIPELMNKVAEQGQIGPQDIAALESAVGELPGPMRAWVEGSGAKPTPIAALDLMGPTGLALTGNSLLAAELSVGLDPIQQEMAKDMALVDTMLLSWKDQFSYQRIATQMDQFEAARQKTRMMANVERHKEILRTMSDGILSPFIKVSPDGKIDDSHLQLEVDLAVNPKLSDAALRGVSGREDALAVFNDIWGTSVMGDIGYSLLQDVLQGDVSQWQVEYQLELQGGRQGPPQSMEHSPVVLDSVGRMFSEASRKLLDRREEVMQGDWGDLTDPEEINQAARWLGEMANVFGEAHGALGRSEMQLAKTKIMLQQIEDRNNRAIERMREMEGDKPDEAYAEGNWERTNMVRAYEEYAGFLDLQESLDLVDAIQNGQAQSYLTDKYGLILDIAPDLVGGAELVEAPGPVGMGQTIPSAGLGETFKREGVLGLVPQVPQALGQGAARAWELDRQREIAERRGLREGRM